MFFISQGRSVLGKTAHSVFSTGIQDLGHTYFEALCSKEYVFTHWPQWTCHVTCCIVRLSQSQRARQKLWHVQFRSLFSSTAGDAKKNNFWVIIFFRNICPEFFLRALCSTTNARLNVHSSLTRTSYVSWAYYVNNIFTFKKQEKFSWHKCKTAHNILYGWNVILLLGISQMKAFLSPQEIPLKRLPFLDISALSSLSSSWESCHFEIFSCSPLSQVQPLSLFPKPMCHALVFQVPRFWISWLIKCHSSTVSMETK